MFQRPQDVHGLTERVGALEHALEDLRRQIEAVGRQVADTPIGPMDDRWQALEARVAEMAERLPDRPRAAPDPVPAAAPRFQPPGLLPRPRPLVRLEEPAPRREEPSRPVWQEPDDLDLGYEFAPPPAPVEEKTPEETMAALARRISEAVPGEVHGMLAASLAALEALGLEARTARELAEKGVIEVVLRVSVDGDVGARLAEAFEREKARVLGQLAGAASGTSIDTVSTRDIPALVDVCDTARRQFDGKSPFYNRIEPLLRQLLDAAGLESLEPRHGEPYNPTLHNALDLMEADDAGLRDRIESCRYRGYRRHGELLKKAGVVIYR
ncbi:MAG TPA: nucleotide exchange factor GrpE [Candidatus Xenobia bacterium]|jgi:hypothetical protein